MCNRNAYRLIALLGPVCLAFLKPTVGLCGMTLSTSAFTNNTRIPVEFTCSDDNKSPALSFNGVPPSGKSIALIVEDPDAPSGDFIHWVIFNIAASTKALPEGIPPTSKTAFGAIQGQNGRGESGYTGPCPPPGKDHHYHFRLYALDQKLDLTGDAGAAQVEAAMRGHVLDQTDLVGIFSR
jgi:Raf kinase inhibitor-like YbhB/YbcL family protein